MGFADRLKKSFRQLLQKPGTTVSLAPYEALLPEIEEREAALREMTDEELTAAARALRWPDGEPTADEPDALDPDALDPDALDPDPTEALTVEAELDALGPDVEQDAENADAALDATDADAEDETDPANSDKSGEQAATDDEDEEDADGAESDDEDADEAEAGDEDDDKVAARTKRRRTDKSDKSARKAAAKPAKPAPAPLPELTTEQLIEVCALGREAGRRALGERAFDVQLYGAMSMLGGCVAEMATGEGKTLAATIAAFGHVVRGSQVHVLTVNDYLARRDETWMGPVYRLLGLTVGSVGESSTHDERAAAYACDVTYVSISEAGFDFLRDQLITDASQAVMPPLATVLIDEADSILIDEARVPLVIAGSIGGSEGDNVVAATATLVATLRPGRDFRVVDDRRNVQLSDAGAKVVEKAFGGIDLYAEEHLQQLTAVNQALHARVLLTRDVDYIVRGGKVALVDEFRGRVAQRRRWPDGLQAAVEAKEGLVATDEGQILASITVQAFVDLYPTISGMTGTAVAIGDQLREFYKLEVAVIPPNRPNIRKDESDRVYATAEEKEMALIAEVAGAHAAGRPVLIGTLDVAESERLAAHLKAEGVECVVLNAKNDAEEARIIAEAGGVGAVTVSTQMAGRGTDIRLGGSDEADRDEVADLGGLYVIGCGRHDSSRVDDQLRGRAGRQGDPGGSVFFVSAEDSLVELNDVHVSGMADGEGRIDDPKAAEAVAHAQRVAEGVSFEIHRNTWRYGVLMERQRQALDERRAELLTTDAAAELMRETSETWDDVVEEIGDEPATRIARLVALHHLDHGWSDHLAFLADVREGVHLRSLGKRDPLDEFHREAIPAFREMMARVEDEAVETFDEAEIDGPDWAPESAGLTRPSATWTYMVHDNPFGSELERFMANAARALLGKR